MYTMVVSAKIGEVMGLINCNVLAPKKGFLKKLSVYCPEFEAEKFKIVIVLKQVQVKIGNYDECSFTSAGTGTFRAGDDATPFVGEKGIQHLENELKIELVYPSFLESKLLKTLFEEHPYEEVAYDLHPITNINNQLGSGLIGELEKPMDELEFLKYIKKVMKTDCIRYTKLQGKKIKKVALWWGCWKLFC